MSDLVEALRAWLASADSDDPGACFVLSPDSARELLGAVSACKPKTSLDEHARAAAAAIVRGVEEVAEHRHRNDQERGECVVLEGFVTGLDQSWRMDISQALDGDDRSSMRPLFKIFEEQFGHLCTYDDPMHRGGRYMQFGAFRLTIEPINHPRNETYRRRGASGSRTRNG